jgi:hypothetical protein
MNCPDISQLADAPLEEGGLSPELEMHVKACERCQGSVFLVQELLGSLDHPVIEVSEDLVQRTLSTLSETNVSTTRYRPPASQLVASGALGFITAFLAIVTSGAAGANSPSVPLVLSFLVGLGSVVVQGWVAWRDGVEEATAT